MKRRTFIGGASLIGLSASTALGDVRFCDDEPDGLCPHTHGGGGNSGTGSHQVTAGAEFSFDTGTLMRMLDTPACKFIVHHAGMLSHDEFDVVDLGAEQFAIWVRDDASIDAITTSQLRAHFNQVTPLYSVDGIPAQVVRHNLFKPLRVQAYENVLARVGIGREQALSNTQAVSDYHAMRAAGLASPSRVLIGLRRLSCAGLKPLIVDGFHPWHNWADYPLQTETLGYIRKNSVAGQNAYRAFMKVLNRERQMDRENWDQFAMS